MSDRINHRRQSRNRRPRQYRPSASRVEGFENARRFAYPVNTDDAVETKQRLNNLLGAWS